MSDTSTSSITAFTSASLGHRSASVTGSPVESVPSGSEVRSMSIVPASPYATTRGGDAR